MVKHFNLKWSLCIWIYQNKCLFFFVNNCHIQLHKLVLEEGLDTIATDIYQQESIWTYNEVNDNVDASLKKKPKDN